MMCTQLIAAAAEAEREVEIHLKLFVRNAPTQKQFHASTF